MNLTQILALMLILCESLFATAFSTEDENEIITLAKKVAEERFKGFQYGSKVHNNEVDCVQFLGAVIEKLIGRPLSKSERDAVYIDYSFSDLPSAVQNGDDRTRGVQRAMCKVICIGISVERADVRPGDFIQYWIKKKDGTWMGHAAIIARVLRKGTNDVRVAIYGSHKSTNGIQVTDFGGTGLQLIGTDRKVYLARFTGKKSP